MERSYHFKIIYKVLGLLKRVFSLVHSLQAKKVLYISLVHSMLLYCSSPIWHPHLLTDIKALENVQRRATSFIVCNSLLNYHHLLYLKLLPLMMVLEIKFFIKSLKEPSNHFDISRYGSGWTRLSSHLKLRHASAATSNSSRNFFFKRLPRLWNSLPHLDINQSIPTNFIGTFGAISLQTLIQT